MGNSFNASEVIEDVLIEYRKVVVGSIQKRISSKYDRRFNAEDVYQMACVYCTSNLEKFRGSSRGELGYWVGLIASTMLHTEIDKAKAKKRSIDGTHTLIDDADSLSAPKGHRSALDIAETTEEAESVVNALLAFVDELTEAQRTCIHLRYFSRLGIREVSERMQKSEVAVKGLLKRALAELRRKAAASPQSCPANPVISEAANLIQGRATVA
jgi:RNA polymerase sigma-70 factor (ECF subfamily)